MAGLPQVTQVLSKKSSGHLRIIDRAKDVGNLADGQHVCAEVR